MPITSSKTMLTIIKKLFKLSCVLPFIITMSSVVARPEVVREGLVYYSDNYFQNGLVKELKGEKNIEEVYQHYTYYEAAYDAAGRVVLFKEHKQGKVILEERYTYDGDSSVSVKHLVPIKHQAPVKPTTNEPIMMEGTSHSLHH